MGEWVETEYGRRYKEEYENCTAYFLSEPDKAGKRPLPRETLEIMGTVLLISSAEKQKHDTSAT